MIRQSAALGAAGGGGGCSVCAQDWLNLGGQRGLSNFDQRHLVNFTWQYTTGMGLGGKTLLSGWRGRVVQGMDVRQHDHVGSGLPQTPIFQEAVPGTGFTGTIRPDYDGRADLYTHQRRSIFESGGIRGCRLQASGERREEIRSPGPAQFSLNASLQRSFHLKDRYNLSFQLDANNLLNHVTYTSWNTIISLA